MTQVSPREHHTDSEAVLRSRLLPRISFRSMLVATAVCAVLIAVVYWADQGGVYAIATAIGLIFLAVVLVAFVFAFLTAWAVSYLRTITGTILFVTGLLLGLLGMIGVPLPVAPFLTQFAWALCFQVAGIYLLATALFTRQTIEAESPFADDQLPPQLLAPRDPVN